MHRPIALGAIKALTEIFKEHRPADKVIEYTFKDHRQWGSRDRRQFAEMVYDLVRWWRKYLWLAGIDWPESDEPPALEESDLWHVLAVYANQKQIEVEGVASIEVVQGIEEQPRAVRMSFSNWLDQWASKETKDWGLICKVLNDQAPVFLRTNTLKIQPDELINKLSASKIGARRESGVALVLNQRANVFGTDEFKKGYFEVQDLHSQGIAELLEIEPGQRVIDACAGAGGKTLQIAALLKNKGKILALDVHQRKLDALKLRSRRAGCDVIESRLIESSKAIKRLEGSADRLLLDVPCTGLGVLRRNPDSKWRISKERIEELKHIQADILSHYPKMLKPKGILVYSTCSIASSENEKQIGHFLEQHPEFELLEQKTWAPKKGGGDGFFAAKLQKS
jgi:16S rRNA (cytosine967-C5)-methyltransferase